MSRTIREFVDERSVEIFGRTAEKPPCSGYIAFCDLATFAPIVAPLGFAPLPEVVRLGERYLPLRRARLR